MGMALSKELCGVLALGAEKERAARDFYLQAASRTQHALGKQMFQRLAQEETKHGQLLTDWANQGVCPVDVKYPTVDPDFIKKGRGKVEQAVKADTDDLKAIELAQDAERKAIDFYLAAADTAGDPPSKDLFMRLKGEEDKHLALLTDLYDYMVNPALWSVRNERANFDS
jgi:rubrerythrin